MRIRTGDSTDSTDGSGSTDTAVTDTIVTDAATVQLFRLLVNSDNAFKVAAAKQVAACGIAERRQCHGG
ncbi:MAG: hypothetical protein ACLT4C_00615 [Butyricicoccus sp.]